MEKKVPQRRQLRVNDWKCICCKACAGVCPEGVITLTDVEDRRILRFGYTCGRRECTRCADACPEGILSLTEVAEERKGALVVSFEMASCVRCGAPFTPQRLLDNLLGRIPPFLKFNDAAPVWLRICPQCRRHEEAKGAIPSKLGCMKTLEVAKSG